MLSGTCNCRALSWTFDAEPESTTACNCTICRRYGALWVYGWEGDIVEVTGVSTVYTNGTRLGYHFCPNCGCLVYYRALKTDEHGRWKIAVNLRMIDDAEAFTQLPVYHFDGLDSFGYLPPDGRCVSDVWS